jgi:ADP-ribose pyrophosphatase YjhB (NUDIX family)
MMELAAKVAALVDDQTATEIQVAFEAEHWLRVSPVVGVEALVLDGRGDVLLLKRRDNERWALPGGVAEVGHTPAESALRELWEEAGLRGTVRRLVGMFDSRLWGSRVKSHLVSLVFQVDCDELTPVPGIEMLETGFFSPEALPGSRCRCTSGPPTETPARLGRRDHQSRRPRRRRGPSQSSQM